ncbi:hypothetical protein K0M31_006995 [Melipona bicolor]|uniref:Uncharacterized protein n=1 Tax=Melipona bicolor TaxID=60889 RepID=A0AA40FS32_9HYME|nr:hypothetical protein K0M31_006995 [Melipona bicolor]
MGLVYPYANPLCTSASCGVTVEREQNADWPAGRPVFKIALPAFIMAQPVHH